MSKDTLVTQVKLRQGNKLMTTWVDATQTAADIDARGWDNNDYTKHTGLWV